MKTYLAIERKVCPCLKHPRKKRLLKKATKDDSLDCF
jgi:hypothetical protein